MPQGRELRIQEREWTEIGWQLGNRTARSLADEANKIDLTGKELALALGATSVRNIRVEENLKKAAGRRNIMLASH
jgi:hypothetical protein